MSLVESVRQIIEDSAKKEGFTRVRSVCLEIGALSGVEPEAMRFCFDAVMRDSIAQEAALEIIIVPGVGWCMQCEATVELLQRYDPCPYCQCYQVQPRSGMEMRVRDLEVD